MVESARSRSKPPYPLLPLCPPTTPLFLASSRLWATHDWAPLYAPRLWRCGDIAPTFPSPLCFSPLPSQLREGGKRSSTTPRHSPLRPSRGALGPHLAPIPPHLPVSCKYKRGCQGMSLYPAVGIYFQFSVIRDYNVHTRGVFLLVLVPGDIVRAYRTI